MVPAGALRLSQAKNYDPELVYYDNGSKISFMTAAAADPNAGIFIGAGVLQYGGFSVCKVPSKPFA